LPPQGRVRAHGAQHDALTANRYSHLFPARRRLRRAGGGGRAE
jgi:hypothetical protein